MSEGDLALLLGAGDIINLVPLIRMDCAGSSSSGSPHGIPCIPSLGLPLATHPSRRIWIGAGANTWKSDLNLNVEYVKTEGPANAPGASLGIPWMAGIPGTIGGWVKMNAGAFGHSISEVIAKVKVDGKWLSAAECGFSYRHSDITGEIQDVILKPDVKLQTSNLLQQCCSDLHELDAWPLLIVFGRTRLGRTARRRTRSLEEVAADDGAALPLELRAKVLDDGIGLHLVGPKAHADHQRRGGHRPAHLAHPSDAAAQARRKFLREFLVKPELVRKRGEHRLRAVAPARKERLRLLYPVHGKVL